MNHGIIDGDNQPQRLQLILDKFDRRISEIYEENDAISELTLGSSSWSKLVMKHNHDFQHQGQFAENVLKPHVMVNSNPDDVQTRSKYNNQQQLHVALERFVQKVSEICDNHVHVKSDVIKSIPLHQTSSFVVNDNEGEVRSECSSRLTKVEFAHQVFDELPKQIRSESKLEQFSNLSWSKFKESLTVGNGFKNEVKRVEKNGEDENKIQSTIVVDDVVEVDKGTYFPFIKSGMPRALRIQGTQVEMFNDCRRIVPIHQNLELSNVIKNLNKKHFEGVAYLMELQTAEEEKLYNNLEDGSLKANYKYYDLLLADFFTVEAK